MSANLKTPGTLLIRADASPEIGTGHVMRCLALAQAWQDQGGKAIFVMAQATPAVHARLAEGGFEQACVPADTGTREDADYVAEAFRTHQADWIILDGYRFDLEYQQRIKLGGMKLLLIDDFGTAGQHCADLILNQNYGATDAQYRCGSGTRLLLGPDYAVLRREFRSWLGWSRPVCSSTSGLLVTLGGSDPDGLTARVVSGGGVSGFPVKIVLGGSIREIPAMENSSEIEVFRDPNDMAKVLANSDMSVICAGGTLWECLFMQCATLSYARDEFQQSILERLQSQGVVRYLGRVESFDAGKLAEAVEQISSSEQQRIGMASGGRRLVDGRGVERVLGVMR